MPKNLTLPMWLTALIVCPSGIEFILLTHDPSAINRFSPNYDPAPAAWVNGLAIAHTAISLVAAMAAFLLRPWLRLIAWLAVGAWYLFVSYLSLNATTGISGFGL